ncbi:MAG: HAMP domain-containing protein [Firmicutes bacterium]|nr:HAMP domain-containing protein [Bacillota bacterium]
MISDTPSKGKIVLDDEAKEAFNVISADITALTGKQMELKNAIISGDEKKIAEIKNELDESGLTEEFESSLDTVYYEISDMTSVQAEERTHDTIVFTVILIIILIISSVVSVTFAALISKMLKEGIGNAVTAAKKIADGDLNVALHSDFNNEIGELTNSVSDIAATFKAMLADINNAAYQIENGSMSVRLDTDNYHNDYKEVILAIGHTINLLNSDLVSAVDTMGDYADGNFSSSVKDFKGEKAIISQKLNTVKENLRNITEDIGMLINSASEGNLSVTVAADNYKGDWKHIIESLNALMQTIEEPIRDVSDILSSVAEADFSRTLERSYKGDFKYLQDHVNKTVRNNSEYIKEISQALTQMANNDLNIHITKEYIGEYISIKNAIEDIAESFSSVLSRIAVSADEINIGSRQVASSSADIANGAESQARSVSKLTDTAKELLSTVSKNRQIMLESNKEAASTKEKTDESRQKTEKMLEAMNDISKASSEILNINKTINEIAFQTNLLSLNASVEAARAGEAGKGFAVVASEVGSLAHRSQNAVKYTDELISNVLKKIEIGSQVVTETAQILDEVSENVNNISETLVKGAELSDMQYTSVTGITEEINVINTVTQSNKSVSEAAAAASEELASQSEVFNETLKRFKL